MINRISPTMRTLTAAEINMVSGGDEDDIVVIGIRNWGINLPDPEPDPIPGSPFPNVDEEPMDNDTADLTHVETTCPKEYAAGKDAFRSLYDGSRTARALMAAAYEYGVFVKPITIHPSGFGATDEFIDSADPNVNGRYITWDPFAYLEMKNNDGTTIQLSPIMLLAHEFVHAGLADNPIYKAKDRAGKEAIAMDVANQIAIEMNASNNTHFNTNRDNYDQGEHKFFVTNSISSTTFALQRPGCQ